MSTPYTPPIGIRLWPSELRAAKRRLKEGYTFSLLEESSDTFRFTAVVNPERIVPLFKEIATTSMPEEVFLILEYYEAGTQGSNEQPPQPTIYYSPYLPSKEVFSLLDPFWLRLIHDGFVSFGLANNRDGFELFYSEEKILTCFTDNHLRITHLLANHGLPYRTELSAPTDFAHDHLSLLCHPRPQLPVAFSDLSNEELDYLHFGAELIRIFDMYPVEDGLSFFLSRKDQDQIESLLRQHRDFVDYAEEDFGSFLLDWHDFVCECESAFEGDLEEYRMGLKLRDMLQWTVENLPEELGEKIRSILAEDDERFRRLLTDCRKRLDSPHPSTSSSPPFWYHGIVSNQGIVLRRDLIRHGWFKPS
ncbi:MAG: hypothetical protein C0621_00555 [Desulfuromonas sp.]|nr:MAG: hypothetical protein C0621_00555 [Desulfuromonas sp.]